jgi:organic hydroperoxide reductase OsmC/OhrA
MPRAHRYATTTTWTGNRGDGTASYRGYDRDHVTGADGRPSIPASSDPGFRGDPSRWNPELLLVASLSQCHMLWYLHLCSVSGVVVESYVDEADGEMIELESGAGRFTEVTLRPRVVVADQAMTEPALALHAQASEHCFIANSVNFPVLHRPEVTARVAA